MEDRRMVNTTPGLFFDHFGLLPGRADRDLLHRIVAEFARIPWENLTKFLVKARGLPPGDRLRLADRVISEHLEYGAGGTCFSLTEALGAVLAFAGFRCRPVMADMRHGRNIHCALSVMTGSGERYLADPGYLVPLPVNLSEGEGGRLEMPGQEMVWEPAQGDSFDLVTLDGGNRTWRYRVRMSPVDREEFLGHWQRSFDATGMNSLHANYRAEGRRIYAHNMNLRCVEGDGARNEKLAGGYAEGIEKHFGISRRIALEAEREWRESCRARQNHFR